MLPIIKFILFLICSSTFGFISLNRLLKIRSLVLLIPLSISFGIAAYVFTCHILSFLIGTQKAAWLALVILVLKSIFIFLITRKNSASPEKEITIGQFITVSTFAIVICLLTYFAVSKYGTFDRWSHIPMATTMFHNNVYPPRDCFRPDYVLLYHYGGDLLAGAVQYITGLDISVSYELIATVLSGTTFLSFFALCWLLTSSFKLSLLGGFCAYFGGGLLWLDAVLRYLTKNLPEGSTNWSFLQTFLNLGIHGGINNAPSVLTFISTFDLGNPLLVCSLILFWKMIQGTNFKSSIYYIFFIVVTLFTLFLTADWLYITFWVAVFPFLLILWKDNKKQFIISTFIILFISIILKKSIGNALFLQDPLQSLGRTNIFDIGIKQQLFSVVGWGRLTSHVMDTQSPMSCFSWDFLCELGVSLLLFPIALIYLIKTKSRLAYLLFLSSAMTMPVPVLIDFKLNPVELVRLFAFGNTMLILLITCGAALLYKSFIKNNFLIAFYIIVFCLSPISQLFVGAILSPHIYYSKPLVHSMLDDLARRPLQDKIKYLQSYWGYMFSDKNQIINTYKHEIDFFKLQAKPKDVALSVVHQIPSYAGVYSLLPSRTLIYWEQLYSSHNTLYETTFSTLDPFLLKELNIKWLLINIELKSKLPKETQDILNNPNVFSLAFVSPNKLEIYHVNDLENILKIAPRKTAWMLINRNGYPVSSQENKIVLFPSLKDTLTELKLLEDITPILKKQLITAQAVIIQSLEKQIASSKINVKVEKRF